MLQLTRKTKLFKVIKDWTKKQINNRDKKNNILKQQLEETQLYFMQDPCNNLSWMQEGSSRANSTKYCRAGNVLVRYRDKDTIKRKLIFF